MSSITYAQEVSWMRYYDPTGSIDRGIDVIQAFDGNYVFVANTSNGNYIMKTNIYGQIIWQFLCDSIGVGTRAMIQSEDSCFILAGESGGDNSMQLTKIDNDGNVEWMKKYVTPGKNSRAWSVKQTFDKGYVLCGDIYPNIPNEVYMVKTDSIGNMQWSNSYSGSFGFDIIQSANGRYYLVGPQPLLKLDSIGNEIWNLPIGGDKILQSENGNIFIGDGFGKFNLTMVDTTGTILFDTNYFSKAYFSTMCQTRYGDIILAGAIGTDTSNLDVAYTKISQNGNLIYSKFINLQGMTNESISNVKPTSDNGLIMIGTTDYPTGNDQFDNILTIKTDSSGNTTPIVSIKSNLINIDRFELSQNYPNPFNPSTIINYSLPKFNFVSLKIFDALGREVRSLVNGYQTPGTYKVTFDGSGLTSGVYYYKLMTSGFSETKRMVLVK